MIYGLVDLSRINRTQEQPSKIDVHETMEDLNQMYSSELKNMGVELSYDLPKNITFRASQWATLLKILIQNVIDHSSDDTSKIEFKAEEKNGEYHFQFSNDGIPMNGLYLDRVFEMFKKIHPEKPGVGCGLAIAKEIVEAHNGKIWATNEPYTTFHFTLAM
ncbi:MAG: HAMP domain-containing histidine kinase [Flavobacteriales bacterium]|nr:HAMP domain-containing histidine kinase [Flavobacteriales bacterium]